MGALPVHVALESQVRVGAPDKEWVLDSQV